MYDSGNCRISCQNDNRVVLGKRTVGLLGFSPRFPLAWSFNLWIDHLRHKLNCKHVDISFAALDLSCYLHDVTP